MEKQACSCGSKLLSILLAAISLRAESLLPQNARVAVIGGRIAEQKIYSKYIETCLPACTGRSDIKVFQSGWSGGRIRGTAENDLNPNVATTCYGMNDGSYTACTPQIGGEYEKMDANVRKRIKPVTHPIKVGEVR